MPSRRARTHRRARRASSPCGALHHRLVGREDLRLECLSGADSGPFSFVFTMVASRRSFFPLPEVPSPPGLCAAGRSAQLASDAVSSLNELFCGSGYSAPALTSECQAASLGLVHDASARMSAHFCGTAPRECFDSLVGGLDYRSEPTTCVPMDLTLLSLSDAEPKPLARLLGPYDRVIGP